jgi:hypothetical protein
VLNAHDITHPIDIKNLDLHPELEECIRGILEGPKLTSEEFAFYDSDLAQRPDRLAIY